MAFKQFETVLTVEYFNSLNEDGSTGTKDVCMETGFWHSQTMSSKENSRNLFSRLGYHHNHIPEDMESDFGWDHE
jgi:hypothetical protein